MDQVQKAAIKRPTVTGPFELDQAVIDAFPVKGTKVLHACSYGWSRLSRTAKIGVELPSGVQTSYFLKVLMMGEMGRTMFDGEFESLKAIHDVSPAFAPRPYAWGRYEDQASEAFFLLEEFRDIGQQPADPARLAAGLADLHHRSRSPTGKFGFHVKTCHGTIVQYVDEWTDSWAALFGKLLGHFMDLARPVLNWAEFDVVCNLTLEKVVPLLLLPLQENGRVLKPSIIHGDCWDGNTALEAGTGEAFVFDVCSFYGHNEYDTGNWRAPRHRLSDKAYIENYKKHFPPSEPAEDWDARNILYSLTFNIGNTLYIPGSEQRQVVYDDMTTLCQMFCPDDLRTALAELSSTSSA